MKIAIVEDDKSIREQLSQFLSSYGYEIYSPTDFRNIANDVLNSQSNLVLLDINLPMYDGYYVCREIRKQSNIPIIIVTSRDTELDELMSMNLGADDFITKPYNTQILLARTSSLLKRAYGSGNSQLLTEENVSLNLSNGLVSCDGISVELTKNEHHILAMLMKAHGKITTRDEIMNELWQSNEFIDENTLTVNVNRLRKKLTEIHAENLIKTKRGQGYYI